MKWRILIHQGKISLSCALAFGGFIVQGVAEEALDFDIGFYSSQTKLNQHLSI